MKNQIRQYLIDLILLIYLDGYELQKTILINAWYKHDKRNDEANYLDKEEFDTCRASN